MPSSGSQRDRAYKRLKRLLVLQQVPAGQRLNEIDWASRLGVHRTALREAFARLEAEGWIRLGPKTGYFVPQFSEDDIVEILEVRQALEGAAIDRICRMALNTPEHLQPMNEACMQLERLIGEDYLLGVAEADRRFHEALIAASGSDQLVAVYQRAPLPIIHRELLDPAEWTEATRQTLSEHRSILDALLRGSVADAHRLLQTHLTERYLVPLRG
jgi:DNA-binding GntR family transcriptional regulator